MMMLNRKSTISLKMNLLRQMRLALVNVRLSGDILRGLIICLDFLPGC